MCLEDLRVQYLQWTGVLGFALGLVKMCIAPLSFRGRGFTSLKFRLLFLEPKGAFSLSNVLCKLVQGIAKEVFSLP